MSRTKLEGSSLEELRRRLKRGAQACAMRGIAVILDAASRVPGHTAPASPEWLLTIWKAIRK
jgi:hypothetical protein